MERFGPCQIVEEKINGVNVDDIGGFDEIQNRGRDRVTRGASIRNSDHIYARDAFTRGKPPIRGSAEETIQGDDTHLMPMGELGCGKLHDDGFKASDRRIKLPHHVNDAHKTLSTELPHSRPMRVSTASNDPSPQPPDRSSLSVHTPNLLVYLSPTPINRK